MTRAIANFNEGRIRVYFNKMRQWKDRCNIRNTKARIALMRLSGISLRSYFFNWKTKA